MHHTHLHTGSEVAAEGRLRQLRDYVHSGGHDAVLHGGCPAPTPKHTHITQTHTHTHITQTYTHPGHEKTSHAFRSPRAQ